MTMSNIYDFYTIGSSAGEYDKWDGQISSCICDYGLLALSSAPLTVLPPPPLLRIHRTEL
jgi:hypothetical protein